MAQDAIEPGPRSSGAVGAPASARQPDGLRRLRIGTRGSRLAMAQTGWVAERLRALHPGLDPRLEVISTTGDRTAAAARGEGVFVKEIQRALLEGRVDLAVHSLKDLPTAAAEGLLVAAIPERADLREAIVGGRLAALPSGARVGTGSPRRSAQIRRVRHDIEVVPIRGNVPTRIEKVRAGEVDAALLAAAGLERLGLEADEVLDPELILPAPGQGALAVETRAGDEVAGLVVALEDPATRAAVTAERAVLRALGGGCLLPVAAYGRIEGGDLVLDAAVTSPDGGRQVRAGGVGEPSRPEEVAEAVAQHLIETGALDLL